MATRRTSDTGEPPHDPVGLAVARFLSELLGRAAVSLHYTPAGGRLPEPPGAEERGFLACASLDALPGWTTTLTIRLGHRVAGLVRSRGAGAPDRLAALPLAGLRTAARFAGLSGAPAGSLGPAVHRALRDTVVVELLAAQPGAPDGDQEHRLLAETLEYLIELSGTRVESKDLTHGVAITDVFPDEPRLALPYPSALRAAKRSPLLFDGQRSVLIVDRTGRARTELQRHRLDRFVPPDRRRTPGEKERAERGPLVALATEVLGGIGFLLREDRSIWTFVDGRPLVIRRGEHWTAFPLWLPDALGSAIGGGHAAVELLVQAAMMISVQPKGAILGIVDHADALDAVVADKDRFDLRNRFDPEAMRPETRLHHLIDVHELDALTLSRLASLDGATVVDREGRLLAYGAIVASGDSQHEGARTAAARSLSEHALAVLKVSEDGEVTIFREGQLVATLLRSGADGGVTA